jgi:8-oxo-dGTP pyrophosphatase MutT (NUDIX family)
MAFVTGDQIASWESRYGIPETWSHHQPITHNDYRDITASQKNGRRHDITFYIEADGKIAVIAKPIYPPKLYRAPSGGLDPDESLEEGALREAFEETGLRIQLTEYILRTNVVFECELGKIPWHSHIFRATTDDRVIAPTDHHEIREARWADPSEFATFGEIMRRMDKGGLWYRAALHEQIARLHPLFGGQP